MAEGGGKREEGEEDHFVPIKRGGPLFSLPSPSFFFHSREKRLSVDHCFERGD